MRALRNDDGAAAVSREEPVSTLSAILEKTLRRRASGIESIVPAQLDQVLERSLRKDPNRRFQSAADFRVALVEVLDELDSGPGAQRAVWRDVGVGGGRGRRECSERWS